MPRLLLAQSNCLISKQPGSRSPTAGCHRLPLDMPTDQSIFEGRKQAIDFIANGAPLPP